MRKHQTVSEASMPFLTSLLGILCIEDPFKDIKAELGTQVSCPHSVLSMTMSPR